MPRKHRKTHYTLAELIVDVIDEDAEARLGEETDILEAAV
jgi:hypothetical protein